MTFHKKQLTYLALGVSLISMGACSYNHPNSMPSGYTHHHETYKSPIPPTSAKITIEQRKYMDATQAEQFRSAVYDLLERLTMRAGMAPKPVYVLAPDPMTTFYANLDNDLRESMRHIGYAISDTPEGAYIFTYEARPLTQEESQSGSNVLMILRVFNELSEEARQLTEESGQYFIQGADSLNIEIPRYSLLPSPTKIQSQQISIAEPVLVEPIVEVPDMVKPSSIMKKEVSALSLPPVVSEPVSVAQDTLLQDEIHNVVKEEVKAQAPAKTKISLPTLKKPSRDDIVIINRGDKPAMDMSVEPAMPPLPEALPEENALQQAIPTTESTAVRGRVSLPPEY